MSDNRYSDVLRIYLQLGNLYVSTVIIHYLEPSLDFDIKCQCVVLFGVGFSYIDSI